MKTTSLVTSIAAMLAIPFLAGAEEGTTGDAGTLDKETAAKVYPSKPGYSPYAGRNFPGASALRRYAPAHGDVL